MFGRQNGSWTRPPLYRFPKLNRARKLVGAQFCGARADEATFAGRGQQDCAPYGETSNATRQGAVASNGPGFESRSHSQFGTRFDRREIEGDRAYLF